MSSTNISSTKRAAQLAIAAGIAVGLTLAVSLPANAATVWVAQSDIASARPAAGVTSWWADKTHNGAFAIGTFNGDQALVLTDPAPTDGIRILNGYGTGVVTPTFQDIASNAKYTYAGGSVNFQIEILYVPANPIYGPGVAGTGCTAAVGTYCYTTIKWDPQTPVAAWTDVVADPAGLSWGNSRQVGSIPSGALSGHTIANYLAEMNTTTTPPVILGVGVSIGTSGPVNDVAYVRSVTYAGTTYNFGVEPPAPPAPGLAATGVDALPIAGVGVTLITAGFLVAFLRRRRTV